MPEHRDARAALRTVASLTSDKALWGVCREVDEGTFRTLVMSGAMPECVQLRLLSMLRQQKVEEERCRPAPSLSEGAGGTAATIAEVGRPAVEGARRSGRIRMKREEQQNEQSEVVLGLGSFAVAAVKLGLRWEDPRDEDMKTGDEALVTKVLAVLPASVKQVFFSDYFNKADVALPSTVEEVLMGYEFNFPLELPASLKKVTFGGDFNQHVVLPCGVEEVEMGRGFNLPLELPASLKKIQFWHHFNQPIALPDGVEDVAMGRDFNLPLDLPASLKRIRFAWDSSFNQHMVLPDGVEEVEMGGDFDLPLDPLPASLKKIKFGKKFNQHVVLPCGVEEVEMGRAFNLPLDLPSSLKRIKFNTAARFNQHLVLPCGVEDVKMGSAFNLPLALPASLKKIVFTLRFNQHLVLPCGLEELELGYDFNHPLDLPASLRALKVGRNYSCPLQNLPAGLTELIVASDFTSLPPPEDLPEGLEVFYYPD